MFNATDDATTAPTSPVIPEPTNVTPSAAAGSDLQTYPFRLLHDEKVIAMYPLTNQKRRLGRLASYIFITDSRLIYSAEAKSIVSSSTHQRDFQIDTIKGIEVTRHKGLDSLGAAAVLGGVINFIGLLLLSILLGILSAATSSNDSYGDPFSGAASGLFGTLAVLSGILTVVAAVITIVNWIGLRHTNAAIAVSAAESSTPLAAMDQTANLYGSLTLFALFGPLAGAASVLVNIARRNGVVNATDAQRFASAASVDRVAYEAGALILDIQTRGKLVGKD